MRTTILLITVIVLLRAEGFGLSIACNLKLRSLCTHILEILLHRARPLFTQDEVVRQGASLIAMAFNQHRLAPVGAKPSGIHVQHRHHILADVKPIVIKEHIAQCLAV